MNKSVLDITRRYMERLRRGPRWLDIETAYMGFAACKEEVKGGERTANVVARIAFWGDGGVNAGLFLDVGRLVVPSDTPLADKILELARGGGSPAEELVRLCGVVCDRVAGCRGIVDGECWALGPRGFRIAVESVMGEHARDP